LVFVIGHAMLAAADDVGATQPKVSPLAAAPTAAAASPTGAAASRVGAEEEEDDPDQPEDAEDPENEESPTSLPGVVNPKELPFADLTDADIKQRLQDNPAALGPMSVGFTNCGALVNGVQMPAGEHWRLVNPDNAWATQETVDAIATAIHQVEAAYPGSPPLSIGDISDRDGGRLKRHKSHQAGRDADIGYYYVAGANHWFAPGNAKNLDLARNWAFVRALIVYSDVEMILLDSRIQRILYEYALSIGENPEWLSGVFQYPGVRKHTILRHVRGHNTHFHVRFFNPLAQEMGRRAYPTLLAMKLVRPANYVSYYKVRKGDTLATLAQRYGVSTAQMRRALRGRLRPGAVVRVGRRNGVARVPGPLALPGRHLPLSTPTVLAKVDWTPLGVGGLISRPLTIITDDQGRRIAMLAETPATLESPVATVATAAPAAVDKPAVAEKAGGLAEKPAAAADKPAVAGADQPTDAAAVAGKGAAAKTAKGLKGKASRQGIRYRVRSGDNLWTIAKRYGVSVKEIRAWNGLPSQNLALGQTLLLYVKH
jgi:penicillin-insensitive murein endopeptidase